MGVLELRYLGTQKLGILDTWGLSTWEFGYMGIWVLWNLGIRELGYSGTWPLENLGTNKIWNIGVAM